MQRQIMADLPPERTSVNTPFVVNAVYFFESFKIRGIKGRR
jgi:hypothetical protein